MGATEVVEAFEIMQRGRTGMKYVTAAAMLLSGIGMASAASIPKDEAHMAAGIKACTKSNQIGNIDDLGPGAVLEFCTCYMEKITNLATDQEYTESLAGRRTPSFRAKVDQASDACLKKLLDR